MNLDVVHQSVDIETILPTEGMTIEEKDDMHKFKSH